MRRTSKACASPLPELRETAGSRRSFCQTTCNNSKTQTQGPPQIGVTVCDDDANPDSHRALSEDRHQTCLQVARWPPKCD